MCNTLGKFLEEWATLPTLFIWGFECLMPRSRSGSYWIRSSNPWVYRSGTWSSINRGRIGFSGSLLTGKSGGVTLNDCENVSRDLSAALDVEDIIAHAYTLEVSSPGLDRTLSKPEHFVRFTGSTVKIKTYQPINGQKIFRGKLLSFVEDTVTVELETGAALEITMTNIAKASLEVEF